MDEDRSESELPSTRASSKAGREMIDVKLLDPARLVVFSKGLLPSKVAMKLKDVRQQLARPELLNCELSSIDMLELLDAAAGF